MGVITDVIERKNIKAEKTVLAWYGDYVKPLQEDPHNVPAWKGLYQKLITEGYDCLHEQDSLIFKKEARDVYEKAMKLNLKLKIEPLHD